MWPVRFTEAARAELIDAQDWYEAEAPGLGRRFRAETGRIRLLRLKAFSVIGAQEPRRVS